MIIIVSICDNNNQIDRIDEKQEGFHPFRITDTTQNQLAMETKRRTFLKQTSIAATGMAVWPAMAWPITKDETEADIDSILKKLAAIVDKQIEGLLTRQLDKAGTRWDGGIINDYEIPNAHSTNNFITKLGGVYACKWSTFYLSTELEKPLERAINCLCNVQFEDGTIDLHTTNFHSTPDTAFLVNYLSPVYVVLKRLNRPGLKKSVAGLAQFIERAGKCLLVGGIHTANHRWVVCSALARVHSFFPSSAYLARIEEWLSEGIDVDPDGQYTEQSVAIYSPVIDNMFITVGKVLERSSFYDIVRKNLQMTLYYIQPGLEVLTDASGRQDSAQTRFVNRYYYAYRYLAIMDQNPVFAALCRQMEAEIPEKIASSTSLMAQLMEEAIFEQPLPVSGPIPNDYFKRFVHSGVFRIRRNSLDLSVIERNPTFLRFMKGKAVLQSMRLHAAFFGSKGQFIAEEAELVGQKIILSKTTVHGYFQPFPEDRRSGDGDWSKMPRDQREMTEVQTLKQRVSIEEVNGKVRVEITVEGTEEVPVSIEISFRSGGQLSGVMADRRTENAYFLEKGVGEYRVGTDVIRFGPGQLSHKWAQMRGMLPKQEGESVYLTASTPFRHTIELS